MVEWPSTGQRNGTVATGTNATKRAGTTCSTASNCGRFISALKPAALSKGAANKHLQKNRWLTLSLEQRRMFAHHCSLRHTQHTTYTVSKAQGWPQQQKRQQSLWMQTGVHEEDQAASDCHTLLRVPRITAHFVSSKAGTADFQHTPHQTPNNHQHQRISSDTQATTRTALSYSQHQPNAGQHEARHMWSIT